MTRGLKIWLIDWLMAKLTWCSTMAATLHLQHFDSNFRRSGLGGKLLAVEYAFAVSVNPIFGMESQFLLHSLAPCSIDRCPCDNHLKSFKLTVIDLDFGLAGENKIKKWLTSDVFRIDFGETDPWARWIFRWIIVARQRFAFRQSKMTSRFQWHATVPFFFE